MDGHNLVRDVLVGRLSDVVGQAEERGEEVRRPGGGPGENVGELRCLQLLY